MIVAMRSTGDAKLADACLRARRATSSSRTRAVGETIGCQSPSGLWAGERRVRRALATAAIGRHDARSRKLRARAPNCRRSLVAAVCDDDWRREPRGVSERRRSHESPRASWRLLVAVRSQLVDDAPRDLCVLPLAGRRGERRLELSLSAHAQVFGLFCESRDADRASTHQARRG